MARKTVELVKMVKLLNAILLDTSDHLKSDREALATFVVHFMHECHAYKGFRYLTEDDMAKSKNGHSVGIIYSEKSDHVFPDMSRREYII